VKFIASCCRFLAALKVLTICYTARHSRVAASPWLGLAFLLGTGGAIIHYCTWEEEAGKKICWLKGSPRISGIGKSASVRDKTWAC